MSELIQIQVQMCMQWRIISVGAIWSNLCDIFAMLDEITIANKKTILCQIRPTWRKYTSRMHI